MSEDQQQVKVSKVGRKFAIGYQMGGEMTSDDWIEVISRYRESILEVYFAMPGDMSGRAPAGLKLEERKTDGLLEAFWNDLERLKAMDVSGVMLFNSACYGVVSEEDGRLVGFARVVSDQATTYYLCDVVIDPALRGRGLGKALVGHIESRPEYAGLRGFLITRDAHGLYRKFGYEGVDGRVMVKLNKGSEGTC